SVVSSGAIYPLTVADGWKRAARRILLRMDVSLVLGLVGVVAGAAALALVYDLRGRASRLEAASIVAKQLSADLQSAHEAVHDELADLRSELEAVQREIGRTMREVNEPKAAVEVVPAPP